MTSILIILIHTMQTAIVVVTKMVYYACVTNDKEYWRTIIDLMYMIGHALMSKSYDMCVLFLYLPITMH